LQKYAESNATECRVCQSVAEETHFALNNKYTVEPAEKADKDTGD
jgi:hypothetical protein